MVEEKIVSGEDALVKDVSAEVVMAEDMAAEEDVKMAEEG